MSIHHPDLTPLTPEHGLLAALAFLRYLSAIAPDPPERRTPTLVAAARHAGISWARIGSALGEAAQYVHTLYRDLPPAPLPPDFPCVTDPLDLEAELADDSFFALADPRNLLAPVVAAARHAGISWQDIATAIGVRRQTAHEKYRHLTPEPLDPAYLPLTHVCEIHHTQ